jgi:amino acid adenylation domain-containing protein
LDAALRLRPIGCEGELCIGGPSLAQGYVGQPELTAERFVETPEFGRLYRTGDRAAWGEDGELRFLGRVDAQVKIRGFRVELGEIEAALADAPGVVQAAVLAKPDARGDARLLAYYVGTPEAEALRAALKRRLPSHMIPAAFTRLDALPLTINGKLDERALPDPQLPDAGAATAPRTATERLLVEAFAELFPEAAIGLESHFFDLGGHSLLATQLATRLRKALGIELPLKLLFEQPRLDDLAREIVALQPETALPALVARPRSGPLPLSPAQERLWFLWQMDRKSAAYNIPVALRIAGRLDAQALSRALLKLVERHEALRTRFVSQQGLPSQDIAPSRAPGFAALDLAGAMEADIRAAVEREALKPFDLERDPLLRATLLHTGSAGDILLLTIHHIVADGASMFVLLPELAGLYNQERTGAPAKLPALPVQFADYALWRRDPAFAAKDAASLAYWRQALEGAPEALALPTDFARPERASGAGDSLALELGHELSQAVQRFARERRATPFVVLASAWAALLARWSGQDEVVVGAPLANRNAAETADMVGFLVNTIALRAKLSEAPDFAALVAQMRESMIAALAHGELPFERVVTALAPARNLGRNPIFQAMFALQPAPLNELDFAGLRAEPLALMERVAKFDLTLNLTEDANGFSGALTYATDLFAPATISRMARQFRHMLAEALATPATRVDRLPLIDAEERAALMAAADGPSRPLRRATIPELFAERVTLHPGAVAVVSGETSLSYAELDAATHRLAQALIASGAAGRPVVVMLQRSEALVTAALGVMKAGAIYSPIDPATPDARVAQMLADAAPAVFLADPTTRARAPSGLTVVEIKQIGGETGNEPAPFPPDATAYLIYTSGSTGTPKGVAVSHAALAALADARLQHDPIGPGDRVLATMSVGFDVSLGQLVTPLLSGATVVIAPDLKGMSGAQFWALTASQKITHINSGPAFFDAVMETPPPPSPLKRLMLGGEAFPVSLARKLAAALPEVEIYNMYGPTEACIDATCYRFRGDERGASLPIGGALPNYRVRVLDEALAPTPLGIAGEIFIGGPSLAKGYLNRPEETAQRFVQDPFGEPGDRLYRTGDRARLNGRGEIEFLGRIDAQVKIRGHRIEPDEVAAVLRRQPEVGSAAVVAQTRGRETCLVAYVAPSGEPPAPALLRARAAAALPNYMVPAAFVFVPALPMTINGKLDLKALPAPDFAAEAPAEPTPPRDEMDASLIEIWRGLLEAERIGIDDNFFRLGGHSLLSLRLVAAVKTRLEIELPIAEIYRSQTIRELADAIRSGEAMKKHGPLIKLGDGPGRPIFAFHPVGGGAFGYIGLAEAMAGRRPVYGVQAAGLEAGEAVAESLDEMVESYMGAIRARQPSGPYAFIGHSFGGLVGFEIARRLETMGETVDRLILIDTSPAGEPWTMDIAERTARRIVRLEQERSGKTGEPIDEEQEKRVIAIVANNMRLSQAYTPPRIATPMTYLLARRGDLPVDGRRAYWLAKCEAPVDTPPLECDHFAVLNRENARKLAAFFE